MSLLRVRPPRQGLTREAIRNAPYGAVYITSAPGAANHTAKWLRRDDLAFVHFDDALRDGFGDRQPILDHRLEQAMTPLDWATLKQKEREYWRHG